MNLMPAKSKRQAIAARIALAAKRRKLKGTVPQGASREMMSMTQSQLEEYARAGPFSRHRAEKERVARQREDK